VLDAQIALTHRMLGAEAARRDFGVYDEEILQAIRYHTGGHGAMTVLDKIILLADFNEPTRDDYPGLAEIRALAYTDLDEALLVGIESVVAENIERKRMIHPRSYDSIKDLQRSIKWKKNFKP
jgi:predicted HD superfamily hydrolase involved in NAD metabolism